MLRDTRGKQEARREVPTEQFVEAAEERSIKRDFRGNSILAAVDLRGKIWMVHEASFGAMFLKED